MKNKLFTLNIVSYSILNFIIIDTIIYNIKPYLSVYGQLKGINEGYMIFEIEDFYPFFFISGINILISIGYFYTMYKLYLKENIYKTFLKLAGYFLVINFILFLIVLTIPRFYLPLYFIACITFPTAIMGLIILPLFRLNRILIEKMYSKKI